jgi:hypothetical protein
MRRCFHLQLGGTFWRAGNSHNGQGCAVHFNIVDSRLHEPGHQARANYCLPSSEQWDGCACAQVAQGGGARVMMGLRAAPKEDLAVSSVELVPGIPLMLPGQLLHVPDPPRVDVPPPPTRPASYAAAANAPPAHLVQAEHVHVRVGGQQRPLAAPYAGPYLVVSKGSKTFTIQVGQRQKVISVDRLKAHTGFSPVSPAEAASRSRPPKMPAAPSVQPAPDWGGACGGSHSCYLNI